MNSTRDLPAGGGWDTEDSWDMEGGWGAEEDMEEDWDAEGAWDEVEARLAGECYSWRRDLACDIVVDGSWDSR